MLGLKGIWIPIEILEDANLSDKEKIIYSLILYLSRNNKDCYCTNKTISELLDITVIHSSRLVNSLKNKNYVKIILKRKENSKQIEIRNIIPIIKYNHYGINENVNTSINKNVNRGINQNVKDNKVNYKNNYKNNASMFSYEQRTYSKEELENLYAN